jgi:phosphatidylinositol alpha-1,6-mannosyltransferase
VEAPRTLVVTNDFPPRTGGIQQYVWNLVARLPADGVAVLAPNWPGWRDHDARQPFPIHRWPAEFLWPSPDLLRRVRDLAEEHRADVVLFGHGYPTPLIGPAIRDAGWPYVVLTHGAEVWMARAPAVAASLRWALAGARAATAVSAYTRDRLRSSVPSDVPFELLVPGVDETRFRPDVDGEAVRERYGLDGGPLITCVSRLVPRKGQDVLIRALPILRRLIPDVSLLIVGEGPFGPALRALAAEGPHGAVAFAGELPDDDLPAAYAAGTAFAMPCRSRWAGLEVEGFGIVFLEAAAAGRPAVAGRSGGAAGAIGDGQTGLLVEGAEPKAVALALWEVLRDGGPGEAMGAAGRGRVEREFTWARQAERLARILRAASP